MKLNYKSMTKNSWILNVTILNNTCINEIILSDVWKNTFWTKWKQNYNIPELVSTKKAVLRGKCMALNIYNRNEERS